MSLGHHDGIDTDKEVEMGGPDVHISACLEGKQGLTHEAVPFSGHKHVCQHALLSGLSPSGLITQITPRGPVTVYPLHLL